MYLVVASSGYSTYGENCESNIIENYPSKCFVYRTVIIFKRRLFICCVNFKLHIGSPVMDFARISTCFYVAFSFPVQFLPARNSFYSLLETMPCMRVSDTVADSWWLKLRHVLTTVSI